MIAKITAGGSFGGALDYLLNPKQREQERARERAQEREKEGQQGRQKEIERTPATEAKTREEATLKDDPKQGEPQADGRQQKQTRTDEHEMHAERGRDLAEEYESGQRHRIIGGNMSGQNPRELSREFSLVKELRPDIEKPVHHVSISAGENDHLSVEQWQEIADTYIEKMGFQNSPHVVIQHRGTGRDHIHILTSRIDFDGKVISEWQSKARAEKVMREVEKRYDLERLPMSREVMRAAPTRGEQEVFERTGRMSAKVSLQGHVERALREQPTATEFIEKLQRVGVETIPNLQSTGRVSGISFREGDELMKGSDLGRGFSWGALQKRGLSYEQERDRPVMEAAKERASMGRDHDRILTPPAPIPELERTFADTLSDAARSVVQYEINRLNPLNPFYEIQSQVRMIEQAGRGVATLYNTARDLFTPQDNVERLERAAGLNTSGKDALERLHEAAGLEPAQGGQDAIERLNNAAGVEPPDPTRALGATLDKTLDGASPELGQAVAQQVEEQTIELGIEFLL
jgi:hypothetical protein